MEGVPSIICGMHHLGIDLGGTKIEGIVLDGELREIFRPRVPTRQEDGVDGIFRQIKSLYTMLLQKIEDAPHTLGIGTPGALSLKTGFLKNSNTVCLNGRLTKKDLTGLLGRDLEIENDANCFALAEAKLGAGKGKDLVFGVIMGTGCGGGIVHREQIHTGLQRIGGEWGHMSIDPEGPECYCGRKGCVETFISGGGIERQYAKLAGQSKKLPEIMIDYRQGEKKAQILMKETFDRFGRAMANLINILDPDIVVLGGGVSNIEEFYSEGIAAVRKYIFSDSLETPIVCHQLGDSAGVLGAALLGCQEEIAP